jgi:hypothetical protein
MVNIVIPSETVYHRWTKDMLVPNQLKQFIQEPRFCWMATRNEEFMSEAHRILGLQISGPDSLRFFIYQEQGMTQENLLSNKLTSFPLKYL